MDWLPLPRDFRASLRAARAICGVEQRIEALAELAGCRLGYLEMLQLDDALRAAVAEGLPASLQSVRLALLSSATVDHLAPALRTTGLRQRVHVEVYAGQFGQFRRELHERDSPLHAFRPEYILFSLSPRAAVASVALGMDATGVKAQVTGSIAAVRALWGSARGADHATVIQQSFVDLSAPLFGSFDRFVAASPARVATCLNEGLADAAAEDGVLWLDLAREVGRDGLDAWFDAVRWLQAKMEIAPAAAPRYGELVMRLITAHRGRARKCLVLDLDNTLWGGTIGDDGLEGIVLGAGSARGEAHLELQKYAKLLSERGIVLAVCSKNDPAIAAAVFADHPEMVLRRADIAAFVANWDDKAENLRRIAAELNLGLDSLVFVDDNPAERARIRAALPMVAVPELPADPAHFVRCLARAGYFEAVSFTAEDRGRAAHYAADAGRAELRDSAQGMDDFLRGLEMTLEFGPVRQVDGARAAQLVGKTNQFNTTGRRYTPAELVDLAGSQSGVALQFRLADRFGDNGLVSVMVLKAVGSAGVFEIDNWVMSCRVFGRQLEAEAMNAAIEAVRSLGGRTLAASYVPTKKNGVTGNLFRDLGFSPADEAPGTAGQRWSLNIAAYQPISTHIARRAALT